MRNIFRYIKNVRQYPLPLEPFLTELMPNHKYTKIKTMIAEAKHFDGDYYKALYTIVRLERPDMIMETGVFNGDSSHAILKAMQMNRKGYLCSIDLPLLELNGKLPGWVVPNELRSKWTLKLGKTSDILSPLLDILPEIDIFLHDSEHSYKNMLFEYITAWHTLKTNGLLLSHDISQNPAFREFAKTYNKKFFYMLHNLGGLRK